MKVNNEFEVVNTLNEKYYLDQNGEQRVRRTLTSQNEIICIEDYPSRSKEGGLHHLGNAILGLSGASKPQNVECAILDLQKDKTDMRLQKGTLVLIIITLLATVVGTILRLYAIQ